MPRTLVATLLFLVSLHAGAVPFGASSRTVPQDAMEHDSLGDLSALLVVTADGEAVVKEWTSTPEAHAPRIPTTSVAARGDILTVMLFFSGCGSASGDCAAEVDYTIYKPDGSIYAQLPNNQVWALGPTKPKIIYLSPGMVQIRIEPEDPLGEYTVRATFRNPGAARPLKLQRKFTVSR